MYASDCALRSLLCRLPSTAVNSSQRPSHPLTPRSRESRSSISPLVISLTSRQTRSATVNGGEGFAHPRSWSPLSHRSAEVNDGQRVIPDPLTGQPHRSAAIPVTVGPTSWQLHATSVADVRTSRRSRAIRVTDPRARSHVRADATAGGNVPAEVAGGGFGGKLGGSSGGSAGGGGRIEESAEGSGEISQRRLEIARAALAVVLVQDEGFSEDQAKAVARNVTGFAKFVLERDADEQGAAELERKLRGSGLEPRSTPEDAPESEGAHEKTPEGTPERGTEGRPEGRGDHPSVGDHPSLLEQPAGNPKPFGRVEGLNGDTGDATGGRGDCEQHLGAFACEGEGEGEGEEEEEGDGERQGEEEGEEELFLRLVNVLKGRRDRGGYDAHYKEEGVGRGEAAEWVVAAVVESVGVAWGRARQVARVCGGVRAKRVWEKIALLSSLLNAAPAKTNRAIIQCESSSSDSGSTTPVTSTSSTTPVTSTSSSTTHVTSTSSTTPATVTPASNGRSGRSEGRGDSLWEAVGAAGSASGGDEDREGEGGEERRAQGVIEEEMRRGKDGGEEGSGEVTGNGEEERGHNGGGKGEGRGVGVAPVGPLIQRAIGRLTLIARDDDVLLQQSLGFFQKLAAQRRGVALLDDPSTALPALVAGFPEFLAWEEQPDASANVDGEDGLEADGRKVEEGEGFLVKERQEQETGDLASGAALPRPALGCQPPHSPPPPPLLCHPALALHVPPRPSSSRPSSSRYSSARPSPRAAASRTGKGREKKERKGAVAMETKSESELPAASVSESEAKIESVLGKEVASKSEWEAELESQMLACKRQLKQVCLIHPPSPDTRVKTPPFALFPRNPKTCLGHFSPLSLLAHPRFSPSTPTPTSHSFSVSVPSNFQTPSPSQLGVRVRDLPLIINRFPVVLSLSVFLNAPVVADAITNTLKVPISKVDPMLTRCPELLSLSPANSIAPAGVFLQGVGLTRGEMVRVLSASPSLLCRPRHQLGESLDWLQENLSIPPHELAHLVFRCPGLLCLSPAVLHGKAAFLAGEVAVVAAEEVTRVVCRFPEVLTMSVNSMRNRISYLYSRGFSRADVAGMVVRYPPLLGYSIAAVLRPKIDFWLEEDEGGSDEGKDRSAETNTSTRATSARSSGTPSSSSSTTTTSSSTSSSYYPRSRSDLVLFPKLFSYALDTRIRRRLRVLASRGPPRGTATSTTNSTATSTSTSTSSTTSSTSSRGSMSSAEEARKKSRERSRRQRELVYLLSCPEEKFAAQVLGLNFMLVPLRAPQAPAASASVLTSDNGSGGAGGTAAAALPTANSADQAARRFQGAVATRPGSRLRFSAEADILGREASSRGASLASATDRSAEPTGRSRVTGARSAATWGSRRGADAMDPPVSLPGVILGGKGRRNRSGGKDDQMGSRGEDEWKNLEELLENEEEEETGRGRSGRKGRKAKKR
ncbi:unnamed protein product [Closterium sp. Naga37s-1]|nr:unnamed protein product [Closterium sp. Naga37s-1]